VVLKLEITPHVNQESDAVRLELKQEIQDIVSPNFNGLGPATSKRSAKTMVVLRDQQTIVIGGLMQNRLNDTETKIPLLGDIPILGYFFKNTSKQMQKVNLLIVLTPYVIRDQSDLRRIFKKKLDERREFIRRYTSFPAQEVAQDVDFRHKRGLLSEINRVADQADADAKLIAESKRKRRVDVEPVEMPKGMAPSPNAPSAPPNAPGESQAPPAEGSPSVPPPPPEVTPPTRREPLR
jgi:general secretion pathway protein D